MPRLSVNLNDETAEALVALSTKRSQTITETVRRCVSVLDFVEDKRETHDIYLVDRRGKRSRVVIL